jgi:hypothetical protein
MKKMYEMGIAGYAFITKENFVSFTRSFVKQEVVVEKKFRRNETQWRNPPLSQRNATSSARGITLEGFTAWFARRYGSRS